METKQERSCEDKSCRNCKHLKSECDYEGCHYYPMGVELIYWQPKESVDKVEDAICKGALVLEVDKKEPKVEGEGVLNNCGTCVYFTQCKKMICSLLPNSECDFIPSKHVLNQPSEDMVNKLRAIVRKEVVEEIHIQIEGFKDCWKMNTDMEMVVDSFEKLQENIDKIIAKGE